MEQGRKAKGQEPVEAWAPAAAKTDEVVVRAVAKDKDGLKDRAKAGEGAVAKVRPVVPAAAGTARRA